MTDLLDTNGFLGASQISWEYYGVNMKYIWDAPDAIDDICQPAKVNGVWKCTGAHFDQTKTNKTGLVYLGNPAQIFNDISNCNLANVSWVIPEGDWSDHAGNSQGPGNLGYGPSWVADIVNAIGNLTGPPCDRNNPYNGKSGYWYDTVILVTWDDWGGYSDHVLPLNCDSSGNCTGYGSGNAKEYVYGFRVPLLVVSAYTPPNYVSGPVSDPNNLPTACPGYPYCHDFGSILNFTEWVFGPLGGSLGGQYGIGGQWGIGAHYPYADYYAADYQPPTFPYSLSDFFDFKTYGQSPRTFTPISAPLDQSFFLNYKPAPTDPDDD
jgi:hypothetical protein